MGISKNWGLVWLIVVALVHGEWQEIKFNRAIRSNLSSAVNMQTAEQRSKVDLTRRFTGTTKAVIVFINKVTCLNIRVVSNSMRRPFRDVPNTLHNPPEYNCALFREWTPSFGRNHVRSLGKLSTNLSVLIQTRSDNCGITCWWKFYAGYLFRYCQLNNPSTNYAIIFWWKIPMSTLIIIILHKLLAMQFGFIIVLRSVFVISKNYLQLEVSLLVMKRFVSGVKSMVQFTAFK
jgi:hypothetical protein